MRKEKYLFLSLMLVCFFILCGSFEVVKADYPDNTYVYVAVEGKYKKEYDGSASTDEVSGINVNKYSKVPTYAEVQSSYAEPSSLVSIPAGYYWAYRVGYSTSSWPNYGKWLTETKIFKPGESMAELLSFLRSIYKSEYKNAKLELIQVPITYNISYNANGGSGTMVSSSATYGQSVQLSANEYTKKGHTFAGWATSQNGDVVYKDKASVKNLTTTNGANVTLYAVWKLNQYPVTYDYSTNGGTSASSGVLSFYYGTEVDLSIIAQKENYTFVGWNTDANATTGLESLTMGLEPIRVYAIFKTDITVTFVNDGDSGTGTLVQAKTIYNNDPHAEFLVEENVPIRQEYSFVSWKVESGQVLDRNGNVITMISPGEEIFVVKDAILKTIWDKYPVLEVKERRFTVKEAKEGTITEAELLKKVWATDEEAKNIENPEGELIKGIDVVVKDYNATDFTSIAGDKEIQITYEATDHFGNSITKTAFVFITDTTLRKSPKKNYVRFISRDFLVDETGNFLSSDKGGLEETSIWRKNISYRKLIEETLKKVNSNQKKNEETWYFSYEVCRELQEYTRTYGHVKNALEKFFQLFEKYKSN